MTQLLTVRVSVFCGLACALKICNCMTCMQRDNHTLLSTRLLHLSTAGSQKAEKVSIASALPLAASPLSQRRHLAAERQRQPLCQPFQCLLGLPSFCALMTPAGLCVRKGFACIKVSFGYSELSECCSQRLAKTRHRANILKAIGNHSIQWGCSWEYKVLSESIAMQMHGQLLNTAPGLPSCRQAS